MFTTIVVGTDGSATADDAVTKAGQLAKLTGAALHIVTAFRPVTELVVNPEFAALPVDVQSLVDPHADAQQIAGAAVARLAAKGVEASAHARVGGAADALIGAAEDLKADLIVVGSRGMAGARRMLGSVPNSVSHHAPCTVMIVSTC